jgi:hypothetical protein
MIVNNSVPGFFLCDIRTEQAKKLCTLGLRKRIDLISSSAFVWIPDPSKFYLLEITGGRRVMWTNENDKHWMQSGCFSNEIDLKIGSD